MGVVAACKLLSALPHAVAVLREQDEDLAQLLSAEGMQIVLNGEAEQGMGTSLACGVSATAYADGWVIALADMPLIQPSTILALVELLKNGTVLAAPEYAGRRGHPVAFGRVFREPLQRLKGDIGARYLLERSGHELKRLVVDDPGILIDFDVRTDIEQWAAAGNVSARRGKNCQAN